MEKRLKGLRQRSLPQWLIFTCGCDNCNRFATPAKPGLGHLTFNLHYFSKAIRRVRLASKLDQITIFYLFIAWAIRRLWIYTTSRTALAAAAHAVALNKQWLRKMKENEFRVVPVFEQFLYTMCLETKNTYHTRRYPAFHSRNRFNLHWVSFATLLSKKESTSFQLILGAKQERPWTSNTSET